MKEFIATFITLFLVASSQVPPVVMPPEASSDEYVTIGSGGDAVTVKKTCFAALDIVQLQDMTSSFDERWVAMAAVRLVKTSDDIHIPQFRCHLLLFMCVYG